MRGEYEAIIFSLGTSYSYYLVYPLILPSISILTNQYFHSYYRLYLFILVSPSTDPTGEIGSGYPLISMIVIGSHYTNTKDGAVLFMMFIDFQDCC